MGDYDRNPLIRKEVLVANLPLKKVKDYQLANHELTLH